jgi:hypothetical protein
VRRQIVGRQIMRFSEDSGGVDVPVEPEDYGTDVGGGDSGDSGGEN